MIYFTADLHLGHENIIRLCNRPFSSVEEMDAVLIANWNKKVKKGDTVYILGDLIFKAKDPESYLKELNGNKILILGNHDTWTKKVDLSKYFERVSLLEELNLFSRMLTLCHYPMLEWRNSRKEGSSKLGYLVHGHIHNNVYPEYTPLFTAPNALNAGVDLNGFEPVTIDELMANNKIFKHQVLSGSDNELLLFTKESQLI